MRIDVKGVIVPNDDAWIYDWCEIENTSPQKVLAALEEADGTEVDVYINSGGGDVFAGSEIYSALREYKGTVRIHIVGLAASAASVIACAGWSDISPAAMMMVHNVSGYARGDWRTMAKESTTLQQANRAIAAAYCAKTGMTEAEALDLMGKETWLTSGDALKLGIVDAIAEEPVRLAAAMGLLPAETIEKIRNTVLSPKEIEREKNNLEKLKGAIKNV